MRNQQDELKGFFIFCGIILVVVLGNVYNDYRDRQVKAELQAKRNAERRAEYEAEEAKIAEQNVSKGKVDALFRDLVWSKSHSEVSALDECRERHLKPKTTTESEIKKALGEPFMLGESGGLRYSGHDSIVEFRFSPDKILVEIYRSRNDETIGKSSWACRELSVVPR